MNARVSAPCTPLAPGTGCHAWACASPCRHHTPASHPHTLPGPCGLRQHPAKSGRRQLRGGCGTKRKRNTGRTPPSGCTLLVEKQSKNGFATSLHGFKTLGKCLATRSSSAMVTGWGTREHVTAQRCLRGRCRTSARAAEAVQGWGGRQAQAHTLGRALRGVGAYRVCSRGVCGAPSPAAARASCVRPEHQSGAPKPKAVREWLSRAMQRACLAPLRPRRSGPGSANTAKPLARTCVCGI